MNGGFKMQKVISSIEELNQIILSVIGIPSYGRMLNGISLDKKKKLLKLCMENNVKDSVDFVMMCEC